MQYQQTHSHSHVHTNTLTLTRTHIHTHTYTHTHSQALYQYTGQHSDELSFQVGAVIALVSQVDGNWLHGRLGGQTGLIPVSYVSIMEPLAKQDSQDSMEQSVRGAGARWLYQHCSVRLTLSEDVEVYVAIIIVERIASPAVSFLTCHVISITCHVISITCHVISHLPCH